MAQRRLPRRIPFGTFAAPAPTRHAVRAAPCARRPQRYFALRLVIAQIAPQRSDLKAERAGSFAHEMIEEAVAPGFMVSIQLAIRGHDDKLILPACRLLSVEMTRQV